MVTTVCEKVPQVLFGERLQKSTNGVRNISTFNQVLDCFKCRPNILLFQIKWWAHPFCYRVWGNLKTLLLLHEGLLPHLTILSSRWVLPPGKIISRLVKLSNTIETDKYCRVSSKLSNIIKTIPFLTVLINVYWLKIIKNFTVVLWMPYCSFVLQIIKKKSLKFLQNQFKMYSFLLKLVIRNLLLK